MLKYHSEYERQSRLVFAKRGKSELHRAECWITPSKGNLRDSATEMCTAIVKYGKGGTVR